MAGLMAAMDICKLQSFSTSTVYSSISPFHSNFSTRPCRQNIVSWKRHQCAISSKPISVCRTSAAGCRGLMKGLMVTCKASGLGESEFEEKVVNSELPVLVDFVADWCGPCKLVAPTIDWASEVPSLSLV